MPQVFKTKRIDNISKYKSTNKIEKTEKMIAGYQEAKCLWNVLSQSKQKLAANDYNKLKQKVRFFS